MYLHVLCAVRTRERIVLTDHQKSVLKYFLTKSKFYPNETTCEEVVKKTGLSQAQVTSWFRRQRFKVRAGHYEGIPSISECTN